MKNVLVKFFVLCTFVLALSCSGTGDTRWDLEVTGKVPIASVYVTAELLHLRAAKYGGWIHHKKNTIRLGHWFHLATQVPALVMTFPMRVGDLKFTQIP